MGGYSGIQRDMEGAVGYSGIQRDLVGYGGIRRDTVGCSGIQRDTRYYKNILQSKGLGGLV